MNSLNLTNIREEFINKAIRLLGIEDSAFIPERAVEMTGYKIKKENGKFLIQYGKPCDFFRALLHLSQDNDLTEITRERKFETLGYMIDVARNAVPKIETLKQMALYLAVLGYNRLYIYLEDLFEVKGEPYFGYLRGRYSEEELKDLDEYCSALGMELVPCIQTLAHLNAIFKWQEYAGCCDTGDILLVGDKRTETLIRNMFETVSRVFKTKNIHVGMDEAHLVGRGRYLDVNGYKTGYEVMAEHIAKVARLAEPYGFKLMIWSDMYFRLAFCGDYYSDKDGLPDFIKSQIPENVTLCYWDYFNTDKSLVNHMIDEHLKTEREVMFAGGAWKWTGWNPSNKLSFLTAKVALDACREKDVKNVMLTAWADDGAESSLFTTLPTVVYYADGCYNGDVDEKRVDLVLKKLFSLSLKDFLAADMPLIGKDEFKNDHLLGKLPKILLYNDPLSGVYDGVIEKYDVESEIDKYTKKLGRIGAKAPEELKYIFVNLKNLCKALKYKAKLGLNIRKAYKAKDMNALMEIANETIPVLIKRLAEFEKGFYKQWTKENKDNGYQTHDLRLGGLIKRLETVKTLLDSFIKGEIKKIYELEDDVIKPDDASALSMLLWKDWKYIHSVYVV